MWFIERPACTERASTQTNKTKTHKNQNRIKSDWLTGDHQTSFGRAQARFAGQPMLGATLVALVAIFRANFADVQLAGRQHQVLAVCTPTPKIESVSCIL